MTRQDAYLLPESVLTLKILVDRSLVILVMVSVDLLLLLVEYLRFLHYQKCYE